MIERKGIKSNMIHVATIKVGGSTEKVGISKLYHPLSYALAPIGIYLTPVIQNANYLNEANYDNSMTAAEFIDLIRTNDDVEIVLENRGDVEEVYVYASNETFDDSTYSNKSYMLNVHGVDNLPIVLQYEDTWGFEVLN